MSSADSFKERERALEESFFYARNQELLQQLKDQLAIEDKKKALCQVCGIADDKVLDTLVAAGIHCETLAALSLIPLVLVAWADGKLEQGERTAILKAARSEGVEDGSLCCQMLERWLEQKPEPILREAWTGYVGAIAGELPEDVVADLKKTVLGRARRVAKAAGGLLGVGSISSTERGILEQLEAAFPA